MLKKPQRPPLKGPRGGGPLKPKGTRKSEEKREKPLTTRQERFVHNVRSGKFATAKAAAEDAGYKHPKQKGSELLKHPVIQKTLRGFFVELAEQDKAWWEKALRGEVPTKVVKWLKPVITKGGKKVTLVEKRVENDALELRSALLKHGLGQKIDVNAKHSIRDERLKDLPEDDFATVERIIERNSVPAS
jgi:phage terminase small subunit